MAGDTKGLFWLVRLFRESLQDNKIQPVSDCGSSGRWFKSCQPDTQTGSELLRSTDSPIAKHDLGTISGPQLGRTGAGQRP
jgi:hypothetical protein